MYGKGSDMDGNDLVVYVAEKDSHGRHGLMRYIEADLAKVVYLPHQCDEWIIGGRDEVEAMIEDLKRALKLL